MLDLWDGHGVKVTSYMVGEAAQRHPELAREIVARGHEASGHGPRWSSQYAETTHPQSSSSRSRWTSISSTKRLAIAGTLRGGCSEQSCSGWRRCRYPRGKQPRSLQLSGAGGGKGAWELKKGNSR